MNESRAPMSICFLSDVSLPRLGGAQTVLDTLARRLMARGHQPVVVVPPRREPGKDDFSYPLVRHRRWLSKRFFTRLLLPRLLALHARHRFDLVHCHAAYPQAHVALAFRALTGVPYVVRPHGSDVLPGEAIRRFHRLDRRMRRAICGADLVIAQGEHLKEVICDLGVRPGQVRIVNNGVNLDDFGCATPYPHGRPYILGLGRLMPHKGFDILLRAYALLPAGSPDLIVAGDGPESDSLRMLSRSLGIGDRVHFVGAVTGTRKASLYGSAVCFVCPSRREPFANVILEALASGVAVVATDVGGNPEMVRSGDNGLIVDRESPEALAAAIRQIVGNPTLRVALCAGARASAVRYSWDAIAPQYFALYREVQKGRTGPAPTEHSRSVTAMATQAQAGTTCAGKVEAAGSGGFTMDAR